MFGEWVDFRPLTPPQQPVMREESEAERRAKSKQQRQSRRSTQVCINWNIYNNLYFQGVTMEQLQDARQLASATAPVDDVTIDASEKDDDTATASLSTNRPTEMLWRSRTLETTATSTAAVDQVCVFLR